MKRAFTDRFYRRLAGMGLCVMLVASRAGATPEQGVRPWSLQVEARVSALEAALAEALESPGIATQPANLIELRRSGRARAVVVLKRDPRAIPDPEFQKITLFLESPAYSVPVAGGQLRATVLGSRQGWYRPLVLFEKATSTADRSVLAVVDPFQFFSAPVAPGRRAWIFDPQGEVLHQSEGRFSGSSMGGFEHFANPASTRSFDQLEVRPAWSRSRQLGWLLLEEQLLAAPGPAAAGEHDLGWIGSWAFSALEWAWLPGLACLLVLGFWMRPARSAGTQVEAPAELSAGEVMVPRIVLSERSSEAARPPASESAARPLVPAFDEKAWNQSIIRSRNLVELGHRLMAAVAEGARSPVIFFEFHRASQHLIFREQLGIPPQQAPVGLRIPADEHGGPLGAQQQVQDLLLQRLGVSHFEALELRSAALSGSRKRLLAVFVILQPGVSSHERRNDFERLFSLAGRYYEAILRPFPGPIPGPLAHPRA